MTFTRPDAQMTKAAESPKNRPEFSGDPETRGHHGKGWASYANSRAVADPASGDHEPLSRQAMRVMAEWLDQEQDALRIHAEIEEVSTMLRLRAERKRQGARAGCSRLGVRMRSPRRPGGSFTLEWFLVDRPGRTQYLPRGRGDRYNRPAFNRAVPWERRIALEAERPLGAIRERLRLIKDLERRLQELQTLLAQPLPSAETDSEDETIREGRAS
ncbi:hypothetical protein Thi970DRAFT_00348 [Thiorhodovibrio frisius]|uniref:Uncharacterized protein n=2 Tax=Thiorhodovibrio frisius TaxID=631362 RepID=H8YW45_9GAMM|nr:hypothetical protein Thi970DRAFT_00348 [Thiorhodovibrio frisius]WPL22980.1 hypothetical protein Thiofri_03160 [Thiorhodovibrio frisius]